MAKKTNLGGVRGFMKNIDASQPQVKEVSDESPTVESTKSKKGSVSRVASPLKSNAIGAGKRKLEISRQNQFKTLPLPVSGGSADCVHLEVDPELCFPSPVNPRNQDLLSLDDPEVQHLKHAIETEGQRDPILVRPVQKPDGVRYEIVYGTRRNFVCKAISEEKKESGGFSIRVWSAEIPDVDVRALARGENKDRQDLSAWEKAQDLLNAKHTLYKGKTDTFIAEQEGISSGSLSYYLKLTRMPIELVKLMESPNQIQLTSGCKLVDMVEVFDSETMANSLTRLSRDAPFTDGTDLLKAIKKLRKEFDLGRNAGGAGKPEINKRHGLKVTKSGQVIAKATPNRSKEKQFKIDLYGFDDEQVRDILDAINEMHGGGCEVG